MKQQMTPGEYWERLAQLDPLWAILSDPAKKGRGWTLESFFETGQREISLLFYQLQQLGLEPARQRALDFGCGVGRLAQALGDLFEEVVGVDISPTMTRLARLANRHGDRVSYLENDAAHLHALTSPFDFIYSNIVLQHIQPDLALTYLREFFRLTAPGGVVVFQLPSHKRPQEGNEPRPRPMPDDAYRHALRVSGPALCLLAPGEETTIPITVTNTSGVTWSQAAVGAIRVGNHWLHQGGGPMLVQDDGRVALRGRLDPGESETLLLTVRAPGREGCYDCAIDVVHEGITWFADRGAVPMRIPVDVRPTGASSPGAGRAAGASGGRRPARLAVDPETFYRGLAPSADAADDFPMFGVPADTVEAAIHEAGCTLAHRESDERAGPEWVAYRYFVRKPR